MAAHDRRQSFTMWRVLAVATTSLALLVGGLSPARAEAPTPQDQSVTGSVIGVVTGEGGAPVENASVALYPWDSENGAWAETSAGAAETGVDGRFAITGIPVGRYTVSYIPYLQNKYLSTWWGNHLSKDDAEGFDVVAGDPPFDASATLILGGTISGVVTARGGGRLAYARVEISGDYFYHREFYADALGSYSESGLMPGSYTVHFKAPQSTSWVDYWWDQADSPKTATPIRIEPGTVVTGVNGELVAPSSISGRLVDADGSPVAGMSVSASVWVGGANGGWSSEDSRHTASDGTFTLWGLRAGRTRIRIMPPWSGDPVYAHQWWGNTANQDEAQVIDVGTEEAVSLGDDVLLKVIAIPARIVLNGISPGVGDRLDPVAFLDGSVVGATRSRQWFRDGVLIPGATGSSYVVQLEDVGARISTREEVTAPGYVPVSVELGQTEPVGLGSFAVIYEPRAQGGPVAPGLILEASAGTFKPDPTETSYQWLRNGEAIAGQTSSKYITSSADFGSRLSVVVTMTAPGYKPLTRTFDLGQACFPATDMPADVAGVRAVGSTLSVQQPAVSSGVTVGYQWRADQTTITGATSPTLTLTKAQAGKLVTVTETWSAPGCVSVSSRSNMWAAKTTLAGTPTIHGTVRRHKTLHVHRGHWTSSMRFTYRWYADGRAIDSATHSTLRLTSTLVGKRITVSVIGKRRGYATVTKVSAATKAVR